jgi:type IV secretory pathway VirB9-like protein
MLQKRIAEIIRNLKRVRNENGLTISEIVNLCEKNGEAVSETTVKKVFADGSETFGFNYENTLKPIINALLGDHEETSETDMMISVAQYKEIKIKQLEAQLARQEESYKRRIEFLKHQIDIKDDRIDKRDELITKLIDSIIHHTLKGGETDV